MRAHLDCIYLPRYRVVGDRKCRRNVRYCFRGSLVVCKKVHNHRTSLEALKHTPYRAHFLFQVPDEVDDHWNSLEALNRKTHMPCLIFRILEKVHSHCTLSVALYRMYYRAHLVVSVPETVHSHYMTSMGPRGLHAEVLEGVHYLMRHEPLL